MKYKAIIEKSIYLRYNSYLLLLLVFSCLLPNCFLYAQISISDQTVFYISSDTEVYINDTVFHKKEKSLVCCQNK